MWQLGLHHPRMSDVVVWVLMLLLLDLPSHLVDARRQIFLPRGMLGRVDCPVDANPPVTLTVWTKDERGRWRSRSEGRWPWPRGPRTSEWSTWPVQRGLKFKATEPCSSSQWRHLTKAVMPVHRTRHSALDEPHPASTSSSEVLFLYVNPLPYDY